MATSESPSRCILDFGEPQLQQILGDEGSRRDSALGDQLCSALQQIAEKIDLRGSRNLESCQPGEVSQRLASNPTDSLHGRFR
jgi:hypothetical protein